QEYLEQWHLLANLESDLPSETHSEEQQESSAFFQNNGSSASTQGAEPNDDHQEKDGSEQWFILDEEDSSEVVGSEVRFENEEVNKTSTTNPDENMKQNGDNTTHLSPYAEQWYELEQLKASVRSLSHAAGLPQSPQPSALLTDETLASGLSSGSLSVENLDEVGLQNTEALQQETATAQDERVQEDDPGDSGTSFSMDESGAEPKLPASEWFPLRPNAVGEDDEDSSHVTNVGAVTAAHGSNSGDRLQNIPHAWSDDDSKHSPPERSQPDGRDGPDLKRTPWMANNQPVVVPSSQNSDIDNGTAASKDSASDVSVLSQPQSDHNITPLDIIERSVPPTKKGVSLMSELRQRRAPQLNSDSDTESPVSKLLGPNFRAVQQVLDRLKQEKLTGSVSDEAEEVASERQSLTEESLRSTSSAGLPASTSMSRVHEAQWTSQAKPRSSIERLNRHDAPFSRAFSTHNDERLGERYSLDEINRRFSDSNIALGNATEGSETRRVSNWSSARVPYDSSEMSPVDAVPKSNLEPAAKKSSHDLLRFSSEANSDAIVRMPISTQPTTEKSSLELMRFSAAATSANVRMPSSTQLAVKESSQDLMRFSSAASSATNDRMPASAQLTIKESTQDLMRFSSAASSATNVRMPASTELAVKKPSHDPARFSSATSSAADDDASAQTNDRNLTASKQTGSHSTTDFSSSDEMYRPVLYRDGLENQENRTSSYGIYDIRRSSGPGSTNRRRKALGLEPNPARENASQNREGVVYISGDSTPNSVRDGSRQLSREDVDLAGSAAVYRETTQPGLEYYEGRMERDEGLRRPRTKDYGMVRESNVRKGKQAREVLRKSDFHHHDDDYHSREERRSDRSHGHQSRPSASQDASVCNSTSERTLEEALDIRERSRRLAGQYMESTDSKGTAHSVGGRSGSSRKSRSKYPADRLVSSSLQTQPEQASRSRKHHDSKSHHRSRDGKDSHARLDANISKLSSLISKSTDESISSSSQMSVIPTSRWPSKRSKKHKTSSSSGSSDVSEYFNYAFMEPHLRSSIKHKIRLRELLKSVKARDISPIVRVRENTSTESASFVSSDGTAGREREEETPEKDRGAPSEVAHPPRPQAFDIPISTSRPTGSEPQIPCTCSQRPVAQTTGSYGLRAREERYNGMDFGMPKKRDVGVNIPTPVVSRSQSPSSDYSRQHEDASTQTEEVDIRRRGKRLVDSEPMKSQRKSAKSPLRDAEEFGVISQPSPSKSDLIYRVDQRESKHKPKDRLVASQNSPGHGAQRSSDRTRRGPLPTWFLPLTSKTQTEKRTETNLKTPSRSRTSDELRVDVFDSAVNPSPSLQKLSLQEAFLYARPQFFVKRSQDRVARIEQAAREKDRRKMIAETAAEENRIAEAQRAKRLEYVVSPKFKPRVKGADQLHVPKPRQMTRAEIKELNKRESATASKVLGIN
ncbi:unnamed protein product, partial [Porites evermanni]